MSVTRGGSKLNPSSREVIGDEIKILRPSIYHIYRCWQNDIPCHKKNKECKKVVTS